MALGLFGFAQACNSIYYSRSLRTGSSAGTCAMHPFIFYFESDAFDRWLPTDGSDPNRPPKGQELAEYLKTAFTQRQLHVDGPFEGEGGWTLHLLLGEQEFDLFVHLTALAGSPDEFWILQPGKK